MDLDTSTWLTEREVLCDKFVMWERAKKKVALGSKVRARVKEISERKDCHVMTTRL